MDVTIAAPLTTLMEYRPDEAYLAGSFSYEEADGAVKKLSLKLRTRGNYRRDPDHCDFAPIRLNFRTGELDGTVFAGQDKLKLVTHCRTHDPRFEQHVAREFLAYRMFQALTSISFGVRLFNITYFDTETGDEFTRLGFAIEEDKALAQRNKLTLAKIRFVDPAHLDRQRQNLVHVFEYMIGNTEYSLLSPEPGKNCCHNMEMMSATKKKPPYLPVPFDFDFSGLVNAEYAQPNPRYPVGNVRTRFYKGICSNNDVLPETLDLFSRRRDVLSRIIDESDFLSGRSRRSVRNYIGAFFRVIGSPNQARSNLVERCIETENVYGSEVPPNHGEDGNP